MKKFLIAGSSLAAVAAAGSAGAVDVTLGGSIDMSMEFGVGKNNAAAGNGFGFDPSSAAVAVTLSLAAAGTTDGGLKYGGSFNIGTAGELEFDPLNTLADGAKQFARFEATDQDANILGVGYMTSGGNQVTADEIVSVRINSSWVNAVDGVEAFGVTGAAAGAQDICKLAGWNSGLGLYVTRAGNDGLVADRTFLPFVNPVGRAAAASTSAIAIFSAGTVNGNAPLGFTANDAAQADTVVAGDALDADVFNVFLSDGGDGDFADDDNVTVTNASVFVGPEINVMLASSTTKAIVGAVCVTADSASNTKMYLDATTNVMSVSGAEIFVEGGFGKLVLSASDYSGEVAAVAGAGDQATVDNSGLTVALSSASLLGATVYGGLSLGSINGAALPNFLIGTSADVMGASVAFEIENEAGGQIVDNWDLGLAYSMGDVSIGAALDSAGDWGLSMDSSIAGMALGLTASYADGAHTKSGLSIDGTIGTSLNAIGLEVGFDESMNYSVGMSYSMGIDGLALTAGYSSEDEGGSVGAKLTF